MFISQCLFRGVCFAVFISPCLYPGAYFNVTTSKSQLRNFGEASDFAVIRLCGWLSLRVSHFACNCTEVEGLLGHQFGAVAEEEADANAPGDGYKFSFVGEG